MVKILFVGSFLSRTSGTKSISEKINDNLKNRGFKIILISRFKNQIIRLFQIVISVSIVSYDKMHIDVHSGLAFQITAIASAIGLIRNKFIIYTLRGGGLPEYFTNNRKKVERVFKRASIIQTPSLYLQDFFGRRKVDIRYMPNSIDISKFPYVRNFIKSHSLLWVRAFDQIYNPDLAVKTLYEVKKSFPDATLTMIGPDKGILAEIKSLIENLGLSSSTNITGPLQNDKLFMYYQTHEVFLNTTSFESFGVAVLEAAACGIPVISTKVGEIPYLWQHEENMLIVDSMGSEDFSLAVKRLFDSLEFAKKISLNARKKAESFDWNLVKNQWIKLLSE